MILDKEKQKEFEMAAEPLSLLRIDNDNITGSSAWRCDPVYGLVKNILWRLQ